MWLSSNLAENFPLLPLSIYHYQLVNSGASALPLTWMESLAFPCVRLATAQ